MIISLSKLITSNLSKNQIQNVRKALNEKSQQKFIDRGQYQI